MLMYWSWIEAERIEQFVEKKNFFLLNQWNSHKISYPLKLHICYYGADLRNIISVRFFQEILFFAHIYSIDKKNLPHFFRFKSSNGARDTAMCICLYMNPEYLFFFCLLTDFFVTATRAQIHWLWLFIMWARVGKTFSTYSIHLRTNRIFHFKLISINKEFFLVNHFNVRKFQ